MSSLQSGVFAVVGGSSGLGLGTTRMLLAEGAKHVFILDREAPKKSAADFDDFAGGKEKITYIKVILPSWHGQLVRIYLFPYLVTGRFEELSIDKPSMYSKY